MAEQRTPLGNGVKLLGELVFSGASELLEGRLISGVGHNLIAGAAGLALAPISPVLAGLAVLAVKANSYSRSVNDENLVQAVSRAVEKGRTYVRDQDKEPK